MIELRHVTLSYGGKAVLRDASLEVRPGECVAVMGPNGSGKSTLAKILDGLLLPDSGECLVDGVSSQADPYHARLQVGLVFQDPDDQAVSRRVDDDIAFGLLNIGASDIGARVASTMAAVGISHLSGRDFHTLSGGQKQLVAIAGVLAMDPAYIVLDEPTALLDQPGTSAVTDAIERLKNSGKGVVIITHDSALALAADRVLVLRDGAIVPTPVLSDLAGIEQPELARLWNRLRGLGVSVEREDLEVAGAVEALCQLRRKA